MEVPDNKREIDYLKAFAIILVVFYHVIFFSDIYWYNLFYICLCITLRNVHVPLFILLAGYLCHKQEVFRFWQKKVQRILIPFLFMSVWKLLFTNLVSPEFLHENTIPGQLYDAFICGNLYWFSYCLLVMFLIAPLLWEQKRRIWILLILSLAANILIQKNQWPLTDVLQLSQVVSLLPFFLIGMLLQQYEAMQMFRKRRTSGFFLGAALLIAGVCGYFRFHEDIHDSYYIDFLMGLCLMMILWFLARLCAEKAQKYSGGDRELQQSFSAKLWRGVDRIFRSAGKYSYQIMLLEAFYRWICFRVLEKVLPVSFELILLVTGLTLLFSGCSCMILKRIPGLSQLTGIRRLR